MVPPCCLLRPAARKNAPFNLESALQSPWCAQPCDRLHAALQLCPPGNAQRFGTSRAEELRSAGAPLCDAGSPGGLGGVAGSTELLSENLSESTSS